MSANNTPAKTPDVEKLGKRQPDGRDPSEGNHGQQNVLAFTKSLNWKGLGKEYKGHETFNLSSPVYAAFQVNYDEISNFHESGTWNHKNLALTLIYIFYHFSALRWDIYLKSVAVEGKKNVNGVTILKLWQSFTESSPWFYKG